MSLQRAIRASIYALDVGPLGTVDVSGRPAIVVNPAGQDPQLEIDFSCTMSITPDANMASLRILNLSRGTRERLAGVTKRRLDITAEMAGTPVKQVSLGADSTVKVTTVNRGDCYVEIDGGYLPTPARMFEGSCEWTRHQKNGPTWVTEMRIGDGLSTMMEGVSSKTFPPGTTLFEVVAHVIDSMALGRGNVTEQLLTDIVGPGQTTFPFGFTTLGESKWLLSTLIKDFDGEWFVDRGECYIVRKGEALPDPPLTVSFEQGMINQPEPLEGGKVRVRSMLRPDIRLGRKVAVVRANFEGTYRVERLSHAMNNRVGVAITDMILSTREVPF